jgi:hypothetical protein
MIEKEDKEDKENIKDKEEYNNFYNKYCNLPDSIGIGISIEIDEIYEDLCKIKPSGIFIIDLCMLRLINNIIEKIINIYEWQQSKNLENEVTMIVKDKLPITDKEINDIFTDYKNKNISPNGTIISIKHKIHNNIKNKIKDVSDVSRIRQYPNYEQYIRSLNIIYKKYQIKYYTTENLIFKLIDMKIKEFEQKLGIDNISNV